MVNLKSNNQTQQRILDYLNANASEALTARINAGEKTLKGALAYAKEEARKIAPGAECIVVDDATVFGWIIHFFEEDHIKEKIAKTVTVAGQSAKKPKQKTKKQPAVKPDPVAQLDLFSAVIQG